MKFKELDLRPRLQQAIADRGYQDMTAVQELTLAETLQGRDVTVQSQTGTGKTAAFLVTLLERMLRDDTPQNKMALVIVPTRELVVQIEKEALLLNYHTDFKIGS
ncbi:MAG: DEAD/DEAH box helicase, partial [Candidatus Aminicenantaceae bacterium]